MSGGDHDRLKPTPIGVLLMSFGTAETLDEVPDYLARVRGGQAAPDDLVAEFKRRFKVVGGSPLTRITREQAAALEASLNIDAEGSYRVAIGMRHAPPFIADGLADLAGSGARCIVCIVLSPQYSEVIMGGYLRVVERARDQLPPGTDVTVAGPWYNVPAFLDALTERLRAALGIAQRMPVKVPSSPSTSSGQALTLPLKWGGDRSWHPPAAAGDRSLPSSPASGRPVPVIFTAHSLPRSVADGEPGYIQQLHDTASALAERVGLAADRWQFAYQSAGHTREEWLKPDVIDVLPGLRAAGHEAIVVAPVQFVADHLEVLYDIDVAAREQAEAAGLKLIRTESLNTSPQFIEALAEVVRSQTV